MKAETTVVRFSELRGYATLLEGGREAGDQGALREKLIRRKERGTHFEFIVRDSGRSVEMQALEVAWSWARGCDTSRPTELQSAHGHGCDKSPSWNKRW